MNLKDKKELVEKLKNDIELLQEQIALDEYNIELEKLKNDLGFPNIPNYVSLCWTEMRLKIYRNVYEGKTWLAYYRPSWQWSTEFKYLKWKLVATINMPHLKNKPFKTITREEFLLANK